MSCKLSIIKSKAVIHDVLTLIVVLLPLKMFMIVFLDYIPPNAMAA
jgi:hypothetical protein